MVYKGIPSSGCARCKERRKKCDETRPACVNCQKLGKPCPGYPNQLDLIFENETARVTSKAHGTGKRRRRTKKSGSFDNIKDSNTPHSSSSENLDTSRRGSRGVAILDDTNELDFLPISGIQDLNKDVLWMQGWDPTSSLTFDPSIEHQATSSLFENFISTTQSDEASNGFLNLLIPMYAKTSSNSPPAMATEALAVRTAANFPGGPIRRMEEL